MKLRTAVVGAAAACGLTLMSAGGAAANVMWCVGDPPVQMSSASGTNFTVNTQYYTTNSKQHLSQQLTEQVTSVSDGHGGTLVTVEVFGPAGQSITVVASVNKYKITGQSTGAGDVIVQLDVPVA